MTARETTDWTAWEQGGEVFAKLAQRHSAELGFAALRPVAEILYGAPTLSDWNPEKVSPAEILTEEAVIVAMLVQAWSDRADWAVSRCADEAARSNYLRACLVIHSAVDYLPSGRGSEQ